MKNLSTGTGLALLAGAIVAWPLLDRLMPNANAVGIGPTAVSAVAAAATAQGAPTIVWYGLSQGGVYGFARLYRAWSDGRVECKSFDMNSACPTPICNDTWAVVNNPAQGLTYRSDINFDEKVDGADLGQLLADWGDAPRQDIPPSDCPLALINP